MLTGLMQETPMLISSLIAYAERFHLARPSSNVLLTERNSGLAGEMWAVAPDDWLRP